MKENLIRVCLPGEVLWASKINKNTAKLRNKPITTDNYKLFDIVSFIEENDKYIITKKININE